MTHPKVGFEVLDELVLNRPPPHKEDEIVTKQLDVITNDIGRLGTSIGYILESSLVHVMLSIRVPKELVFSQKAETKAKEVAEGGEAEGSNEENEKEGQVTKPLHDVAFYIGNNQRLFHQEVKPELIKQSVERLMTLNLGPLPVGAMYRERCIIVSNYGRPGDLDLATELVSPPEERKLELVGVIYKRPAAQMSSLCARYCIPIYRPSEPDATEVKTFITATLITSFAAPSNNLMWIENGKSRIVFSNAGSIVKT